MRKTDAYKKMKNILALESAKRYKTLEIKDRNMLEHFGYISIITNTQSVEGSSNVAYHIALTREGECFIAEYNGLIGKIELYATTYPFISALIIGFMGGLGATIFNVLLC